MVTSWCGFLWKQDESVPVAKSTYALGRHQSIIQKKHFPGFWSVIMFTNFRLVHHPLNDRWGGTSICWTSSFATNLGELKITSRIILHHTLSVPEQDGGILWHPNTVIGMVPGWAKTYTCISLHRIGTNTPQSTPTNDSKPGLQESFIECWIAKS